MSEAITIAAPDLLGSAMHFVLTVAARRACHRPPAKPRDGGTVETTDLWELATLWDLAERYHPEQAWLAESWLRGERTLLDLERTAPRGTLSPGFLEAAGPLAHAGFVSSARPARRPQTRSGAYTCLVERRPRLLAGVRDQPHDHAKETP